MMNYLTPDEYTDYGIAGATAANVDHACAVLDAYLSRQEGMLYTADTGGYPLYMTRKYPEGSFTLTSGIAAGLNVPATISRGVFLEMGAALVLDKADAAKVETVYVSQVVDNTHVILAEVLNAHNAACTVESGLVIEETLNVPRNRSYVTLSKSGLTRFVSAIGRVGYARKGDTQNMLVTQAQGIAVSLSQFGGAPTWQIVNVSLSDIELGKNQVWLPSGISMLPYSEVRVSYVAGYTFAALPMAIKRATAALVKAIVESPASTSIQTFKAGEVQMERFISSVFDEDLQRLLSPYRANVYG